MGGETLICGREGSNRLFEEDEEQKYIREFITEQKYQVQVKFSRKSEDSTLE